MSDFSKKQFGFTKSQLLVFLALRSCESLTMTQTAEHLSSSKEQATRVVSPLVDGGYVERHVDTDNRTKIHIRLTDKGSTYIEEHVSSLMPISVTASGAFKCGGAKRTQRVLADASSPAEPSYSVALSLLWM